jgi:hypothetical protein
MANSQTEPRYHGLAPWSFTFVTEPGCHGVVPWSFTFVIYKQGTKEKKFFLLSLAKSKREEPGDEPVASSV